MTKLQKILIVFAFFTFFTLSVQTAFAANEVTEGSGTGDNVGQATQNNIYGGPDRHNTGSLLYMVDSSGTQKTDTYVFYSSSERPPASCKKLGVTKFGKSFNYNSDKGLAPWGMPFDRGGVARGGIVKSQLAADNKAWDLVKTIFANEYGGDGDAALEAFITQDLFLVIEPFYWGQVYNGRTPTGTWLCATAEGWAKYQKEKEYAELGSPMINRYTNAVYPHCFKLESEMWGMVPKPGNAKMGNSEIIGSGNGFISVWSNRPIEIRPEDTVTEESIKNLYQIRNWSKEFDISQSIPAGEEVSNYFEADSFYGSVVAGTRTTPLTNYKATYTYEWTESYTYYEDEWDKEFVNGVWVDVKKSVKKTGYRKKSKKDSFSFSARQTYQYIKKCQLYALEDFLTLNDAFPDQMIYHNAANPSQASSFHFPKVVTDVVIYDSDEEYGDYGSYKGIIQVPESHYYLPSSDFIEDKTITVTSEAAAKKRIENKTDRIEAEKAVVEKAWSRNDKLILKTEDNGEERSYILMQNNLVAGCEIINGSGETGAAYTAGMETSPYRYGGAGMTMETCSPAKAKGITTITIPYNTDNKDYPTGIETHYTNVVNTVNEYNTMFHSGKSKFADADSIYDHIYSHPLSPSELLPAKFNGTDPDDGYPVKVHTPVISPVTIVNYLGEQQTTPDKQLIDRADVDFQLKLDGNYFLKWNGDLWLSAIYGDEPGYGESDRNPSKYDEYVMQKEVRFPFDVYYDECFYEADTWIVVNEPDDWQNRWEDGVETYRYESNNHWTMTPFYIPSYAEEGTGTIEVRVLAKNTYGRYDGEHSSDVDVRMNSDKEDYVATYAVTDQVSGVLYGYAVTGVSDKEMYDCVSLEKGTVEWRNYPLAESKQEKISGHNDPNDATKSCFNRFGHNVYRYLSDGSLTYSLNDYNFLPLRKGSNYLAGTHIGDGRFWRGSVFSYQVKTIANMSGDNDYIEILPSFTFVTKDENGNKKVLKYPTRFFDNDGDGFITGADDRATHRTGQNVTRTGEEINKEDLILLYKDYRHPENFVLIGSQIDAESVYDTSFDNPMYEESYYTKGDALKDSNGVPVRYGDWVHYTIDRYNEVHRLSGWDALTDREFIFKPKACFSSQRIILSPELRMLSGEWEQLQANEHREGTDLITYYDFDSNGSRDDGLSDKTETRFRDSMQTWFGNYYVPTYLRLYDNSLHDFIYQHAITEDDFEHGGEIIINFDIIAYKDGKPHLAYGGAMNGGIEWEKEGYGTNPPDPENPDPDCDPLDPNGPYTPGDVVVYDNGHGVSERETTKLWCIN